MSKVVTTFECYMNTAHAVQIWGSTCNINLDKLECWWINRKIVPAGLSCYKLSMGAGRLKSFLTSQLAATIYKFKFGDDYESSTHVVYFSSVSHDERYHEIDDKHHGFSKLYDESFCQPRDSRNPSDFREWQPFNAGVHSGPVQWNYGPTGTISRANPERYHT